MENNFLNMCAASPISQNGLFYTALWSRNKETIVLQKLVSLGQKHGWVIGKISQKRSLMKKVTDELKDGGLFNLQHDELEIKLLEWEVRHANFNFLITRPGVDYLERLNSVEAPPDVWDDIAKVKLFLLFKTYYLTYFGIRLLNF